MVPTRDFSGLTSCACALASAAAIVPIVSLERCTACLRFEEVKAHRARFGALGPDAMADGLFGVPWHQGFELCLASLMVQKGLPGAAEYSGKLRPGVRGTHVNKSAPPRPWALAARRQRGEGAR